MGVSVQRLQCQQVSDMNLIADNEFTLLVGGGAVLSLVIIAAILVTRNNKKKKMERRKTSHVTEVLQVDMVDRRIRSTGLDHSLDIEEMMPSPSAESRADAVLRPIAGLNVTRIE